MDFLITPVRVSGLDAFFTIPFFDDDQNVIQHDIYIGYNGLESWSNSELQCCSGGITQGMTYGDAFYANGRWEFLNTPSVENSEFGAIYSGVAIIGVCCVKELSFDIYGKIEIRNNGYDCLAIYLNGVQQYYRASVKQEDASQEATETITDSFTISLTPRPCGDIITIVSHTIDYIANNEVKWSVGINAL
jgi:hypothetical protein